MGLEAVPVGMCRLVGVAGLGVDRRDHPVGGGAGGDAPLSGTVARLDVLAGDQGQQGHGVGLLVGELECEVLGRPHQLVGVVDQLEDETVDVGRILPVTGRTAAFEVVPADPHRPELGDEAAHPADLGDQYGHGVLALDGIVEDGGVQRPAGLGGDHPRGLDHRAHRVEDALGAIGGPQLVAPQDQHRGMERLVGQGQPGRRLPGDVGLQAAHGLMVRQSLEGLEDHDRGDDIGGHRGATTVGREQVGEQLVGEQRCSVLGQKGVYRALPEQVPAECRRIQQCAIRGRRTLHPSIGSRAGWDRESSGYPGLLSGLLDGSLRRCSRADSWTGLSAARRREHGVRHRLWRA